MEAVGGRARRPGEHPARVRWDRTKGFGKALGSWQRYASTGEASGAYEVPHDTMSVRSVHAALARSRTVETVRVDFLTRNRSARSRRAS